MILLPTLKPCQCKLDEAYEEENHLSSFASGSLYELTYHLLMSHVFNYHDTRRLRDINHNGAMVGDWLWLKRLHERAHNR